MVATILVSAAVSILIALLWWRAHATKLYRDYPVFYGFLAVQLLFDWMMILAWVFYGRSSDLYEKVWHFVGLSSQPMHVAVLFECLHVLRGLTWKRAAGMLALGALFATPAYSAITSQSAYYQVLPMSLMFQVGVWAVILWYIVSNRVAPGPRTGGFLGGLLLLAWLEGLNHLQFSRDLLPYSIYEWLTPAIYIGVLSIWLFSLSPTRARRRVAQADV